MIYVGVDIAKQTHFAAALSSQGEILIEPFKFTNDYDGFQRLLSSLASFEKDSLLIGLESTAHYGNNLVNFLFSAGFKVCVINPIQTSTLRNQNIRKTKTDKVDALLVAKALMITPQRCLTEYDMKVMKLKSLSRFRQKLVKTRTRTKVQMTTYVDQVFPELQYFFKSGIHIKTCHALLAECSAPEDIASMHLTHLASLLKKASYGRFGKEKAQELRVLAQKSVGTGNASISIQITQSLIQIELFDRQIAEITAEIKKLMDSLDSVILTIPGVSYLSGALILGEIGDIHRFPDHSKLLAFAGLDPAVKQSGKFKANHTPMSKRGSSTLRYALVNAAFHVVLKNRTFKAYYDLKVSQGRSHYNALGHCAGKLVRIIHKMLTNNLEFNLD